MIDRFGCLQDVDQMTMLWRCIGIANLLAISILSPSLLWTYTYGIHESPGPFAILPVGKRPHTELGWRCITHAASVISSLIYSASAASNGFGADPLSGCSLV